VLFKFQMNQPTWCSN